MRNDIIEYLQKEVYRRCKQPTNKFGITFNCYEVTIVTAVLMFYLLVFIYTINK